MSWKRALLAALALGTAACPSKTSTKSPDGGGSTDGGGPSGCAASACESPLGEPELPPSPGSCPASAPLRCGDQCCPSSASCAQSGPDAGCAFPSQPALCPPNLPISCAASPSCDGGCVSFDASPEEKLAGISPPACYVPGAFNTALSPNCGGGTDGPVTVDVTGLVSGGSFTFEGWLRVDRLTSSNEYVFSAGTGLRLWLSPAGTFQGIGLSSNSPVPLQQWTFFASTYDADGGAAALYQDGAPVAQAYFPSFNYTAPGLGEIGATSTYPLLGAIDELRVLSVAESAEQIAQDFDAGVLSVIPGTVGLWHFDAPQGTQCCPAGSQCGLGGACVGPDAGSPPLCPPGSFDCGTGFCCAQGETCTVSGCETTPVAQVSCPSSAPVLCPSGDCCPSGYACAAKCPGCPDQCVLNAPATPGPACASGDTLIGSWGICCPPGDQATFPRIGNQVLCGENSCGSDSDCDAGYSCQLVSSVSGNPSQCMESPAALLCDAGMLCGGGCCGPGETCAGTGCCPSSQPACGAGCCDPASCDAGTCTSPTTAGGCDGGTACLDLCCGPGSSCDYGATAVCLDSNWKPATCPNGQLCGGSCCDLPWVCVGGSCAEPPATGSSCSAAAPVSCPGAGACCPSGSLCWPPGSGSTSCWSEGLSAGGPGSSQCSVGSFCDAGTVCSASWGCCPDDHPRSCGGKCCLPGAECAGGVCLCPVGRDPCGTDCCGVGELCAGGQCVPNDAGIPVNTDPCGVAGNWETVCPSGASCQGCNGVTSEVDRFFTISPEIAENGGSWTESDGTSYHFDVSGCWITRSFQVTNPCFTGTRVYNNFLTGAGNQGDEIFTCWTGSACSCTGQYECVDTKQ